jgi:hypothetical protein
VGLAMAQLPRQRYIKQNKYVPVMISKDSTFFQQIDSLIFNSIYSTVISEAKVKIFKVECKAEDNHYILNIYMTCQLYFLKNITPKGYFEYNDYYFFWYGTVPNSLWNISTRKKKFTYMKGEPFEGPIFPCDLAEFTFDYIEGKLILTRQKCF